MVEYLPPFALAVLFLLPYAIERLYFKERFGGFALIFYMSLILFLIAKISVWALAGHFGSISGTTLESIFTLIASISGFALFLIPSFTVVCIIAWILVKIGQKLFADGSQD